MLHLFRSHSSAQPVRGVGTGLLVNGLLCLAIGLAIFAVPELVAYFIAGFLVFIGVSLLLAWSEVRRVKNAMKR